MHKGWFLYAAFHRISSEFRVYVQLGLIPIYENQPNHMKSRYIKIENFRTLFQEFRTKKLSDKYDIKKQARYQKDVKTDCDSIININLHGDYHIYKDIFFEQLLHQL